jgi:Raf kinase inhibitor-like YbhB/YbcL family protein
MNISSPVFSNNGPIPKKYTCDGENINPPLSISGIPENTKSLVLIVDDPDAPRDTWVHWTVFNINAATAEIPENSVPSDGIEAMTNFGEPGYGGPCPPSGTHRYFFKLYALDSELELMQNASKQEIEKAMTGRILAKTEIIGLYQRVK